MSDENFPICPDCGRVGTMTDDHIFEGADFIAWWCENCDKELKRIKVNPNEHEYTPVIFPGGVGLCQ